MTQEVTNGVVAFVLAFCGGWFAVRLTGLAIRVSKAIKAERDRKARLEWFKRRGPHQ